MTILKKIIIITFEILILLTLLTIFIPQLNYTSVYFPISLAYISLVISIHFWRKPIMIFAVTVCTPIIILHFLGYKLYSQPVFDKNLIHMPDGGNLINRNSPILKNHFTIKEFIAPNIIMDMNNTQHVIDYIIFTKKVIKKNNSWKDINLGEKSLSVYILPDKHYYIAYKNITYFGCGCFGCSGSFSFFSPEKRSLYELKDISTIHGIFTK